MSKTKYTFFKDRMALLGVTDKNPEVNQIDLIDPYADTGMKSRPKSQLFSEDKDGNIVIHFWNINGEISQYEKVGDGKMSEHNAKTLDYQQIRKREPKGDFKYSLPRKAPTRPWIPKLIVEAYREGKQVDTIYLTEGAFKAFKASQYGMHVFGLTSINHYKDQSNEKLHFDILEFIRKCKVKNVIIIWDGDCLDISLKQLDAGVNLDKRPNGFLSHAKSIRNLLHDVDNQRLPNEKLNVFFWYIKAKIKEEQPKGLDDLFIVAEKHKAQTAVQHSMKVVNLDRNPHFSKFDITRSFVMLSDHFYLKEEFLVQFYRRHAEHIGLREFKFCRNLYVYDEETNEPKLISPGWASRIKWIGNDYYLLTEVTDAYNSNQLKLISLSEKVLKDKFKLHKASKLSKYLDHHVGFVNIPNHFKFQQTIKTSTDLFYNKYFPFTHKPKEGSFDKSIQFIKHIFGEKEVAYKGKIYKEWELGLDYVQLLLEEPIRKLPVLILFSKERNTGKSTFWDWLKFMFSHNAILVGNNDFGGDFNSHYVTKLLVGCEETLLEKKAQSELIKALATAKNISMNVKNKEQQDISLFAKFIFMTNNDNMIKLDPNSHRFWIRKIPSLTIDDPYFLEKLKDEFPAFLHYMQNRKLATPDEGRMYFHYSMIRTDAFYETVRSNEPGDARNIRFLLKEYFIDTDVDLLMMPMNDIIEVFAKNKEPRWVKTILEEHLSVTKLRDPETKKTKSVRGHYFKINRSPLPGQDGIVKEKIEFNGRPYVFHRRDFVEQDDEAIRDENFVMENAETAKADVASVAGAGGDLPF